MQATSEEAAITVVASGEAAAAVKQQWRHLRRHAPAVQTTSEETAITVVASEEAAAAASSNGVMWGGMHQQHRRHLRRQQHQWRHLKRHAAAGKQQWLHMRRHAPAAQATPGEAAATIAASGEAAAAVK